MGRCDGVLTGYEKQIMCTDETWVVEVLQRWGVVWKCTVEMEYSVNMCCKGG